MKTRDKISASPMKYPIEVDRRPKLSPDSQPDEAAEKTLSDYLLDSCEISVSELCRRSPLGCHILVFLAMQTHPLTSSEILKALKAKVRGVNARQLQAAIDILTSRTLVQITNTSRGPIYFPNKDLDPTFIEELAKKVGYRPPHKATKIGDQDRV